MKREHLIAVLSIVLSVALSSLGASYFYGQQTQKIEHNTADIQHLKTEEEEIHTQVTEMRIENAHNNATVTSKLDHIMEKLNAKGSR